MRKVFVTATVNFVLNMDEGIEVSDVIHDMKIATNEDGVDIESHDVTNYEITDSREIRMYFHGPAKAAAGQKSFVAVYKFLRSNLRPLALILLCGSIGFLCGSVGVGIAIGLIIISLANLFT